MEDYTIICVEDMNGMFIAYVKETPSIICVTEKEDDLLKYLEIGMSVYAGNKDDRFNIWENKKSKERKCLFPMYIDTLPSYYVWKCCQVLGIPIPEECKNGYEEVKRTWERQVSMFKTFEN